MTCVHKVRWSVKRPEDCRFRLSVSHYKDRIVAPDEYSGATVVTPSDSEQVLATKDKTVRANIAVNPAPVESLATSENGTFLPSSGNVGFSEVVVDVEPSLESLSVTENGLYLPESGTDGFDRVNVDVSVPSGSTTITQNGTYDVEQFASAVIDVPTTGYNKDALIYEGDFSAVTNRWAVTAMPDGSAFAFDKIEVEISNAKAGTNSGWRQYWRSDLPTTGNQPYMLSGGVRYLTGATALLIKSTISIDGEYITLVSVGYDADNSTNISADAKRVNHGGYNKITAYAWWGWECPAGTHIKITGYNRTT